MDFGDSPDEGAFRLRLREWLAANNPGLPPSSTADEYWAGQAAWHQRSRPLTSPGKKRCRTSAFPCSSRPCTR